ncbi:hypothetical protein CTEN210_18456 [Chaetoceros tenuissimus]|uniref:MYND-type domain-containing protein n=1 Tax=Chaetoceros tenuissimus TaxID=426638 RepID=A0AAD3DEM4_9STRA|nr:hypothetical protein CTEN210_18456 [Chaetoceros tenuissimus]
MRICSVCKEDLPKESYSKKQWLRPAATRKCAKCVEVEVKGSTAKSGHNGTKKQSSTEAVELAMKLASVDISEIKPPRPTAQILGRIRKNTQPTAKVLKELLDALTYERQTPSYLKAVEHMKNTKISPTWIPPRTYETDGMLEHSRQSYLLGPPPLTFNILKHDFNKPELGGEGLVIRIEELMTTVIYLGECFFTLEDLWFFAVRFRTGKWKPDSLPAKIAPPKPEESDHRSILLCPFCATLLNPCDEKKKYIMIGQLFTKFSDNGVQPYWMPQVCCRSCFGNNHISTRPEAEKFDDFLHECELNGVKRMYLRQRKSSLLRIDCPNARDLYKCTISTGLANAFMENFLSEMMKEYGESEVPGLKKKMKKSKTMSEEAGFSIYKGKREVINICNACGLESNTVSACSACNNTYYCSRDCQRKDWKAHKRSCGERNKKDPLPSDDIVVSKEVEVNTADMEAMKNKCNICLKYKGDTHGCEAYCLGCGSYMYCGPCNGRPEANFGTINNGKTLTIYNACEDCSSEVEDRCGSLDEVHIFKALHVLLERHPVGMHVKSTRLSLALLKLYETPMHICTADDLEHTRNELMWLANNLDYAPAQLALACLYDPVCHQQRDRAYYDGPLDIGFFLAAERRHFEPNPGLAKKYYNRACEQKLACALEVVGNMYRDGSNPIFAQNILKGVELLEQATKMGHTKAQYEVASYYWRVDQNKDLRFLLLQMAAEKGHAMAMYNIVRHIASTSMHDPGSVKFGKRYMELLLQARNSKLLFEVDGDLTFDELAKLFGLCQ